jgi:hypothetical protein
MFLCENVIIEEKTRYVTLINCFSRRKIAHFPSVPMDFILFAVLLNGRGQVRLDTVIEDLDTSDEIDRRSNVFNFFDPKQEFRFRTRFVRYSFDKPHSYEFKLLADGEMIANTILNVSQMEDEE